MGVDLFEVREWPIAKKLVYGEHMLSEQMAQEDADGDLSGFDYNGMPTPSNIPNAASGARSPPSASTPSPSQPSVDPSGSQGWTTPSGREVHPALAGYNNIIHVNGDEDDES